MPTTSASPSPAYPPPGEPARRRDSGDACPGALRLHTADDGALARVRLPGGALTAAQAYALADAAERLGDGELHLTSRGNVQLRGLPAGCGAELAELLGAAGLLPSPAHERVRNVVASPLSGLDGRGHADVQPWARELDRLLCGNPSAAALSGRFLFAFDDGSGDVASLGADVTVTAGAAEGTAWVRIGGGVPGGAADARNAEVPRVAEVAVRAEYAARAALLAAELFLADARDGDGQAWRIDDLPGAAARIARIVAARTGAGQPPGARAVPPEAPPPTPAPHEPADRFGPSASGAGPVGRVRKVEVADPSDQADVGPSPEPGLIAHGEGHRAALSVSAPFGTFSAAQWRLLAAAASAAAEGGADADSRHGTRAEGGELRVTPWRGVIVPGLDPADAAARLAQAQTAGLVTSPESPWYGVGACIGRPGCGRSLADVRADARDAVLREHRRPTPDAPDDREEHDGPDGHDARQDRQDRQALPVYWSGCARRCGHPKGAYVDAVATGDGRYELSVLPGEKRHAAVTSAEPTRRAAGER